MTKFFNQPFVFKQALLAVVFLGGGYWLGVNHSMPSNPDASQVAFESTVPVAAQCVIKNDAVDRAEIKAVGIQTSAAGQDLLAVADVNRQWKQCQLQLAELNEKHQQEFIQRKQNHLRSILSDEHAFGLFNQQLKTGFVTQMVDPEWAKKTEAKFSEYFKTQAGLSDFSVVGVECKTELCKVSIEGLEADIGNRVSEKLVELLKAENSLTDLMVLNDASTGTTDVYIRRDQKGFEFN